LESGLLGDALGVDFEESKVKKNAQAELAYGRRVRSARGEWRIAERSGSARDHTTLNRPDESIPSKT